MLLATGTVGKNIARAVPIFGAGVAVADAGDIAFGQDSFATVGRMQEQWV